MKRVEYNKLVRDKIIDIINENGEIPSYRILDDEEMEEALMNKLREEVKELSETEEDIERKKEIADVLEVIDAIGNLYGYDMAEIRRIKAEKAIKRGKFNDKVFLESVDE